MTISARQGKLLSERPESCPQGRSAARSGTAFVEMLITLAVVVTWAGTRASGESGEVILRPAAIIAGRYVDPNGSLQPNTAIVLSKGKIEAVVPAEKYVKTADVVRHPHAVLCPGLIDLRSAIGAFGNAVEQSEAVDPGASATDALDRDHRDFGSALRSGITAAVISPTNNNLISGVSAVVRTAGSAEGAILRGDGPLMLALGPSVLEYDREPTSRMGSLAMLREALGEARTGRGHERLQAFVAGRLDAMVACDEPMDVSAALRTFAESGGRFAIAHTSDAPELPAELAAAGRPIIIGPYTFGMSPRILGAAAAFAAARVPVAFAGRMPQQTGDALRVTAALAVRYGFEPASARLAMTATAAQVAGVADRIGAIRPGLDADLVVFSDDPLRLDARVLEVYIEGVRVYRAPPEEPISGGAGR